MPGSIVDVRLELVDCPLLIQIPTHLHRLMLADMLLLHSRLQGAVGRAPTVETLPTTEGSGLEQLFELGIQVTVL